MSLGLDVIHASRNLEAVILAAAGERWANLSVSDLVVVVSIHENSGLTAAELTRILNRDKTTISRCLSSLRREGIVSSRLDPLDGRQRVLMLTKAGDELAAHLLAHLRAVAETAAESLSEEGVEAVEMFLRRLFGRL